MNTKTTWLTVIGIAAVIILAILTYMFVKAPPAMSTEAPTSPTSPLANSIPSPKTSLTSAQQTVMVTYANGIFSPNPITIKKGDTVMFMNNSLGNISVASDPHPTHTEYPTTGGCVGSTFDSCAWVAPGASWSFTFDIIGSWGYHNHMAPGERGTVIVE